MLILDAGLVRLSREYANFLGPFKMLKIQTTRHSDDLLLSINAAHTLFGGGILCGTSL